MKAAPALQQRADDPPAAQAASARHGAISLLGAWNFYFILKLLLFWRGLINGAVSYPILLSAMDAATLLALWAGCARLRFWPNSLALNARIADADRLAYRRARTAGIYDRH